MQPAPFPFGERKFLCGSVPLPLGCSACAWQERRGQRCSGFSRAWRCGQCGRRLLAQVCLPGKGLCGRNDRFLATKTPLAFAVRRLSPRKIITLLRRCRSPSPELLQALSAWQEPCLGDGRVGAAGTQRQQKRIATIARSRPQRPLRPRWRLLWSRAHPKTT